MPDKTTTYVSTSGEISTEEIAKAQALYQASQRHEGEDKREMPVGSDKSATGAINMDDVREAMSKTDDQQSDSAPTG